jgi:hypothetical protein
MPLSATDHVEIRSLYAEYCFRFDAPDPEGFARLFAHDGRFVLDGQPDRIGTQALTELVVQRTTAFPNMRHHTSNILVGEAPGGANGRASVLVLRAVSERLELRTAGEYEDAFVRESGAWRFARRHYRPWLPGALVDGVLLAAQP